MLGSHICIIIIIIHTPTGIFNPKFRVQSSKRAGQTWEDPLGHWATPAQVRASATFSALLRPSEPEHINPPDTPLPEPEPKPQHINPTPLPEPEPDTPLPEPETETALVFPKKMTKKRTRDEPLRRSTRDQRAKPENAFFCPQWGDKGVRPMKAYKRDQVNGNFTALPHQQQIMTLKRCKRS